MGPKRQLICGLRDLKMVRSRQLFGSADPACLPIYPYRVNCTASQILIAFSRPFTKGAAALEEPLRRVKDGERVPPWFPEEAFRALYTAGKSLRPDEQSSVRALRVPQDDPAGEFVWHPDRGHTLSIALRRATRNGNCYVRR